MSVLIFRFLLRKLGIVFVEDDFKDEKDPRKSEIIENVSFFFFPKPKSLLHKMIDLGLADSGDGAPDLSRRANFLKFVGVG